MTAAGTLRPYQPRDRAALYDICLRTGRNGEDATALHADPELLGATFAVPYATLEPELTFVIDDGERAVGYILGTRDTVRFVERYQREWLPGVAERFPEPTGEAATADERIRYFLHHPELIIHPELADYPAHLHIDILPSHQGGGNGRALMTRFLAALTEHGVDGVHLVMGAANTRAGAFYRRMGFHEIPFDDPDMATVTVFGRDTKPE
jgi:ribosomal protein S18 acetylase RimI-like enzyme